jgi:hypothetical protein
MADNVIITKGANATPPSGTEIATDDVGGVQFQRVKLDVGGDGVSTPVTDLATSAKQDTVIGELQTINSLVPDAYDYIDLTYTGDNLTSVVFKTGGAGGTTVSTLTLAYTGARLDSVTQS